MSSAFLNLNLKDIAKGGASAVCAAVVLAVYQFTSAGDFNLFTADWANIGSSALNAAVYAFIGYVGKNALSTSDGKFLGKIG